MQLKKRFSVSKGVAIGTATAAMLLAALPALAMDTDLESRGSRADTRRVFSSKMGLSNETRALQSEIRTELKLVRQELRASIKSKTASTTAVPQEAKERKLCKKEAQADYKAALETAREERDASMKAGQAAYLAALKTARDAYHAATEAVAPDAADSQAKKEAARAAYKAAVEMAQKNFKAVKKALSAEYHKDLKAAREAREQAVEACKA